MFADHEVVGPYISHELKLLVNMNTTPLVALHLGGPDAEIRYKLQGLKNVRKGGRDRIGYRATAFQNLLT